MEITIRHTEKTDFAAIKRIYAQPVCYADTLQLPYPSDELWENRVSTFAENSYNLVAVAEGEVVGQLGLEVSKNPRRKHVANFGMGVSESHQNKGVGTKLLAEALMLATRWLAVTRVELVVYTDNAAGIALYKKHGFVIEGEAKAYAFRDGVYVDVYFMAKVTTQQSP